MIENRLLMRIFGSRKDEVFDKFPKYHAKILLADFTAKVGREDVLNSTSGNESLHKNSNDNG
jgi:hypothetical protein